MQYRLLSAALVVVCAAAPSSATVVTPNRSTPAVTSARGASANVAGLRRTKSSGVDSCSGKATPVAGPNSFVGVSAGLNYAGDAPTENPNAVTEYAGVVAGTGNLACSSYTGILAGQNNTVGSGDFIDFSAFASVIGGGSGNGVSVANYAIIGAGTANTIGGGGSGFNANNSGIFAGSTNSIAGQQSFIGAGSNNAIQNTYVGTSPESISAFIGAGDGNTLVGSDSVITGGSSNTIGFKGNGNGVSAQNAAIGGGYTNKITSSYGTVGGGYGNTVTGAVATIAGGYANTASGQNAAVPGGASNAASGRDSFAAGFDSRAANDGTFVWSDTSTTAGGIASTAPNEFLARAAGGFYLFSSSSLKSGVKLAPGSGSWSSLSDRAAKMSIEEVDAARILAKVAALPVSEWSYTAQGTGVRHLGPMAQDFRAAFGLGEDDKHISTIDEEGVALAAIKALHAENDVKDRQIAALRAAHRSDEERLQRLERRVDALSASDQGATEGRR